MINESKLDQATSIQRKVAQLIKELDLLQDEMTIQERALLGGWAFLVRNPWASNKEEFSAIGGEIYHIYIMIRQAFEYISSEIRRVESKNRKTTSSVLDLLRHEKEDKILN